MKYLFLFSLLFVASPLLVSAHPGNTDSNGGHYCRTNYDYWGVPWNQWHSHSGSSYRSPVSVPTQNYYTAPVSTYKSNSDCPSYGFAYMGECYELPSNARKSAFSGFTCNYGYEEVGYGLSKKCLPEIENGSRIGTTIFCDYGYQLLYSSCLKKGNTSTYSGSSAYSSEDASLYSCPKNSSASKTDASKCTCNLGYEVNSGKNACKKISKKTNDKICRVDFGKNSIWTGKYDKEEEVPTCKCKKNFKWNSNGGSCVKS